MRLPVSMQSLNPLVSILQFFLLFPMSRMAALL